MRYLYDCINSNISLLEKEGNRDKLGPNLGDIYGRISGGDLTYSYSKNLESNAIRWNRYNLINFILNPNRWVNKGNFSEMIINLV